MSYFRFDCVGETMGPSNLPLKHHWTRHSPLGEPGDLFESKKIAYRYILFRFHSLESNRLLVIARFGKGIPFLILSAFGR